MGAGTELVVYVEPVAKKAGGRKPIALVTVQGVQLDEAWSATYHELAARCAPGEQVLRRNNGGLYINPAPGTAPARGDTGDDRLALAAAARGSDALGADEDVVSAQTRTQLRNALDRQSFNRVWARAAAGNAYLMLSVDVQVLEAAARPESTVQQQRLALQVIDRWSNRLGGKAVAPTEQVAEGSGSIVERMRRGGRGSASSGQTLVELLVVFFVIAFSIGATVVLLWGRASC